jgi:hypothetical protein
MALALLPGRVAIQELVERRYGSLYLPDASHDTIRSDDRQMGKLAQSSHRGIVLAAGPPAKMPWGSELPLHFQPGDEVVYVYAAGGTEESRRSFYGDTPCVMIAQEEVLGVIEPETHVSER